jgi:hypothetical protein
MGPASGSPAAWRRSGDGEGDGGGRHDQNGGSCGKHRHAGRELGDEPIATGPKCGLSRRYDRHGRSWIDRHGRLSSMQMRT